MVRILLDAVQSYVALASCCSKVDPAMVRDDNGSSRIVCLSCLREIAIVQIEPDPCAVAS